jgi:hypothetical protein
MAKEWLYIEAEGGQKSSHPPLREPQIQDALKLLDTRPSQIILLRGFTCLKYRLPSNGKVFIMALRKIMAVIWKEERESDKRMDNTA